MQAVDRLPPSGSIGFLGLTSLKNKIEVRKQRFIILTGEEENKIWIHRPQRSIKDLFV